MGMETGAERDREGLEGSREGGRKEDVLEYNGKREGDIGGLEPRDTTKSHHATELKWEAYWGEMHMGL